MKEFWTDMQAGMEAFSTGGQFMALFFGKPVVSFSDKAQGEQALPKLCPDFYRIGVLSLYCFFAGRVQNGLL